MAERPVGVLGDTVTEPGPLSMAHAPPAEGTCVGRLEGAGLLVLQIEGGDVEDEDRSGQPEDRLQARLSVERLGYDPGDRVDRAELGAMSERRGWRERAGHRPSPETGSVKINSVPVPSWLFTWIEDP